MAGDRTPIYLELDARRVRKLRGARHTYAYEGETTDPRFEESPDGTRLAP